MQTLKQASSGLKAKNFLGEYTFMHLLKTIRDSDFNSTIPPPAQYKERHATRAIVFDAQNYIGLIYSTKKNYHKLPGGGVEEGEELIDSLKREVMEEIGCHIDTITELGIVEEFRNKFALHQISHCYIAYVLGAKNKPNYEQYEIAEGFEPVWMSLDEAIATLEREGTVEHYEGKFMQLRDFIVLKEGKKIISNFQKSKNS